MTRAINITIENKLVMEKRDINVYHHVSKSGHLISYNNSITLPLRSITEDDYLHVSVVSGPGHLKGQSIVILPSWIDFEFSSREDITVIRSGDRTLLKIPQGPPMWQLKMIRSPTSPGNQPPDRITIGDEKLEQKVKGYYHN